MDRNSFLYPPYTRLIEIIIKHKQKKVLDMAGDHLTGTLKKQLGDRVMGPEYPVISRIRNHYLKRILLKIEKEKSIVEVKEFVIKCIEETKMHNDYKSLIISVDVDPA